MTNNVGLTFSVGDTTHHGLQLVFSKTLMMVSIIFSVLMLFGPKIIVSVKQNEQHITPNGTPHYLDKTM